MNEEGFCYYLKELGLATSTINEHFCNLNRFKYWATQNQLQDIIHIRYNDLLAYIHYLKAKGLTVPTQNIQIASLRKYFEYLKQEGFIDVNPTKRLTIKGAIKKIVQHPLSYTELEALYQEYTQPKDYYREEKNKSAHKRNIIVLGLMIWQGIHSGELSKLELEHIKLEEGMVYIPGGKRSNPRTMKLESKQIITLHHYLTTRAFKGTKLFSCRTNDMVYHLVNELKGINPVIRNANHIRASVILHWLRMYNKRAVQQMIGHKWISSTEHYEVQELEALTDLLEKHHPFN